MSRTEFIESLGATCKNVAWSWSFIDESNKRIIFGAWEDLRSKNGKEILILSDGWQFSKKGIKKSGYTQAIEHIKKVLFEGYSLFTFKQVRKRKTENDSGVAKIDYFEAQIHFKNLVRRDDGWYASEEENYTLTPQLETALFEGEKKQRLISYYERNPKNKSECIAHHGVTCKVCGFDFEAVYGELGRNYIQAHHIVPMHKIGKRYQINPKKDLVPLCANCHVMIHVGKEVRTIRELRELMIAAKNKL